jgi:hypothetical protein
MKAERRISENETTRNKTRQSKIARTMDPGSWICVQRVRRPGSDKPKIVQVQNNQPKVHGERRKKE